MKADALTKDQDAGDTAQKRAIEPAGFVDRRPAAAVQRRLAEAAAGAGMQLKENGAAQLEEKPEEEEPAAQAKAIGAQATAPAQRAQDGAAGGKDGLPSQLKAGIESMSGMSMNHVKVHYNSDKPAQLNAHAYAQGSDIHVAPGQEQHLPHEAWHVVQQAQGRVQPTAQLMGETPINDDKSLESEADQMGAKAMQQKAREVDDPS